MPRTNPHPTAAGFVPPGADLPTLARAMDACRGCDLWEPATQAVPGTGPASARVVLVGEQPGDQEDRRGEPFVGPAGRLLDRALEEAGIARDDAYVTNAVKHFKFTMTGSSKRRIHAKPDTWEVAACRPWLQAELSVLDPEVVVCLGATAAQSLLGPSFRVTQSRGVLLPWPSRGLVEEAGTTAGHVLATIHPSAVLRADDKDAALAGLVSDLRVVAQALA